MDSPRGSCCMMKSLRSRPSKQVHQWWSFFQITCLATIFVFLDGSLGSPLHSASFPKAHRLNSLDTALRTNEDVRSKEGFCLSANQACLVGSNKNLIIEFNETFNTIGCVERCEQVLECEEWTWWGDTNSCQLFSSCSEWFSECPDCQSGPRTCGLWNYNITALSGGVGENEETSSDVVTLVGEDTCNTSLTMPIERWGHISAIIGEKYYLCGGSRKSSNALSPDNSCHVYNTVTRKWSEGSNMLQNRHHGVAVEVFGRLFVLGGLNSQDVVSDAMEVFEPESNIWSHARALPQGIFGHCAVAIRDAVVVTGGENAISIMNQVLVYNVTLKTWSTLKSMTVPRSFHGCSVHVRHTTHGSSIHELIVTGGNSLDGPSNSVEMFSYCTNTWKNLEPLPFTMVYHAQLHIGKLRLYGGEKDGEITDKVIEYDRGSWSITELRLHKPLKSMSITSYPADLVSC